MQLSLRGLVALAATTSFSRGALISASIASHGFREACRKTIESANCIKSSVEDASPAESSCNQPGDTSRIDRLSDLTENLCNWEAKLSVDLCPPNDPSGDPVPTEVFSLAKLETGEKYYFHSDHKPSETKSPQEDPNDEWDKGWNELKRIIQRKGYVGDGGHGGSELLVAQTPGTCGNFYVMQCFRGFLSNARGKNGDEGDGDEYFSAYVRPKKVRRVLADESKKAAAAAGRKKGISKKGTGLALFDPDPSSEETASEFRRHCYACRPTKKEDMCKLRLTIFVDKELDRFYVKSGVGCPYHRKHPKLDTDEILSLASTVEKDEEKIQEDLGAVSGTTALGRRLLQRRTGRRYGRAAIKNMMKDKMDLSPEAYSKEMSDASPGSEGGKFVKALTSDPDVKAVFLFDDGTKSDLVRLKKGLKYCLHREDGSVEEIATSDCPEGVNRNLAALRTALSMRDGRILVAAAWTSIEESRRFKLHPEVCSWDVTESTNAEHRGLFMGLNYDSSLKSNVHTNVFIPSGQRWVFDWIARVAFVKLHGEKSVGRVQLNIFDQAPNEFGPFLRRMPKALLRLCWFHRGIQKTTQFKSLADTDAAKDAFKTFDKMCNHLFKRTTTANEVRHRNYKYGETRIDANSSLTKSAVTQNTLRKDSTNTKRVREARTLVGTALWAKDRIIDRVSSFAARVFVGFWQSRTHYAHARVSEDTWLVMSPKPEPKDNPYIPQYRRVRTVQLVGGKYLVCDCDRMKHLGICCSHILSITNEVHESCFTVRWWNDYSFYYLRDGVGEEVNRLWEDLAFMNPPYPGVLWSAVPAAPSSYPVLCDKKIPISEFTKVWESPIPILSNYSESVIKSALDNIKRREAPVGMSQEMHGVPEDGSDDGGSAFQDFPDYDTEAASNHADKQSFWDMGKAHLQDMAKREDSMTPAFRNYVESELSRLAGETLLHARGKFDPPSNEGGGNELDEKGSGANGGSGNNEGGTDDAMRCTNLGATSTADAFVSMMPETEKRKTVPRIKLSTPTRRYSSLPPEVPAQADAAALSRTGRGRRVHPREGEVRVVLGARRALLLHGG